MEPNDPDSLEIITPKRKAKDKKNVSIEEPVVPVTPKVKVKKEMTPEYLANLKRGRELLLVKKAEQRLKAEEMAIQAKMETLKASKKEELNSVEPIACISPEPVPIALSVLPAPAGKKPRAPRVPREPRERIVEKIVEVERIVYQTPQLKFCFV